LLVPDRDDEKKAIDSHFKQWVAIGEQVRAMIAPAVKHQEQIQKTLRPLVDSQMAFQKSLEPMLSRYVQWPSSFSQSFELPTFELPDLGPLVQQAEHFRKAFEGIISPAFQELQRSFKELPPRTQEAVLLLGEHGWYL